MRVLMGCNGKCLQPVRGFLPRIHKARARTCARAHEHNVCLYLCGIYISLNRRKNVDLCLSIAYPNVDKIVSYKITWLCVSTSNKTTGGGWESRRLQPLLFHMGSCTRPCERFSTRALKCVTTPPSYTYFPSTISSGMFFQEGFKLICGKIYRY